MPTKTMVQDDKDGAKRVTETVIQCEIIKNKSMKREYKKRERYEHKTAEIKIG